MSSLQACAMPWMRLLEQNLQESVAHIRSQKSFPHIFYNYSGRIELDYRLLRLVEQDVQKFNLIKIKELLTSGEDVIIFSTYDSFDRLISCIENGKIYLSKMQ